MAAATLAQPLRHAGGDRVHPCVRPPGPDDFRTLQKPGAGTRHRPCRCVVAAAAVPYTIEMTPACVIPMCQHANTGREVARDKGEGAREASKGILLHSTTATTPVTDGRVSEAALLLTPPDCHLDGRVPLPQRGKQRLKVPPSRQLATAIG